MTYRSRCRLIALATTVAEGASKWIQMTGYIIPITCGRGRRTTVTGSPHLSPRALQQRVEGDRGAVTEEDDLGWITTLLD